MILWPCIHDEGSTEVHQPAIAFYEFEAMLQDSRYLAFLASLPDEEYRRRRLWSNNPVIPIVDPTNDRQGPQGAEHHDGDQKPVLERVRRADLTHGPIEQGTNRGDEEHIQKNCEHAGKLVLC